MAARITNILPYLLITLLCVGLVEGGYQALEHFALRVPSKQAATSEVVPNTVDKPVAVDAGRNRDYNVILERNLFGPAPGTKTTNTPTEEKPKELETTNLNIVLMGTINGDSENNRAIILDKSTNKQQLYVAGDAIQGASIKEIQRGKVILSYNGKDEMLDMSEAAKVRSSYATPAPANRPGLLRRPPSSTPGQEAGNQQRPPSETSRRVINRPRAIRPSRIIRRD